MFSQLETGRTTSGIKTELVFHLKLWNTNGKRWSFIKAQTLLEKEKLYENLTSFACFYCWRSEIMSKYHLLLKCGAIRYGHFFSHELFRTLIRDCLIQCWNVMQEVFWWRLPPEKGFPTKIKSNFSSSRKCRWKIKQNTGNRRQGR